MGVDWPLSSDLSTRAALNQKFQNNLGLLACQTSASGAGNAESRALSLSLVRREVRGLPFPVPTKAGVFVGGDYQSIDSQAAIIPTTPAPPKRGQHCQYQLLGRPSPITGTTKLGSKLYSPWCCVASAHPARSGLEPRTQKRPTMERTMNDRHKIPYTSPVGLFDSAPSAG